MSKLIYIADDELNIRKLIESFLTKSGFEVMSFSSGDALQEQFVKQPADMLILDIMMPGVDGFTLCSSLRNISRVPIIIVSARDSEADRITGLALGCDDYLIKPFSPMELVMRVKALFRRIDLSENSKEIENITVGNLVLSHSQKRAECNGDNLYLTLNELNLISFLAQNKNRAVSREELLNKVWGFDCFVETRATDDAVKRIRKKLAACNCNVRIETVWGFGFMLAEGGKD